MPGGVIADAFYSKGNSNPQAFLDTVAELVRTSADHAAEHKRESAPVWIPRNGKDSQGIPYVVLTCTDCLRSFPLSVATEELQKIQETPCLFCPNTVRYVVDFLFPLLRPSLKGAHPLQSLAEKRKQPGARLRKNVVVAWNKPYSLETKPRRYIFQKSIIQDNAQERRVDFD